MATCSARKSVVLPLPSSPHWRPTITVAGMSACLLVAGHAVPGNEKARAEWLGTWIDLSRVLRSAGLTGPRLLTARTPPGPPEAPPPRDPGPPPPRPKDGAPPATSLRDYRCGGLVPPVRVCPIRRSLVSGHATDPCRLAHPAGACGHVPARSSRPRGPRRPRAPARHHRRRPVRRGDQRVRRISRGTAHQGRRTGGRRGGRRRDPQPERPPRAGPAGCDHDACSPYGGSAE